jgi:hypothetical protein
MQSIGKTPDPTQIGQPKYTPAQQAELDAKKESELVALKFVAEQLLLGGITSTIALPVLNCGHPSLPFRKFARE